MKNKAKSNENKGHLQRDSSQDAIETKIESSPKTCIQS